jgi:hypothetical protein
MTTTMMILLACTVKALMLAVLLFLGLKDHVHFLISEKPKFGALYKRHPVKAIVLAIAKAMLDISTVIMLYFAGFPQIQLLGIAVIIALRLIRINNNRFVEACVAGLFLVTGMLFMNIPVMAASSAALSFIGIDLGLSLIAIACTTTAIAKDAINAALSDATTVTEHEHDGKVTITFNKEKVESEIEKI